MAQHEGSHTLSAYQSYASSVRVHPTTLPPTVSLLTVFSLLACGNVRALRPGVPYELGSPPARIPASATATCFCRPLRPDSVRGTFTLVTRGMRQITGRVDAALYFTAWNDSSRHVTYPLHHRLDAVK